jgi:hypothetical protein
MFRVYGRRIVDYDQLATNESGNIMITEEYEEPG